MFDSNFDTSGAACCEQASGLRVAELAERAGVTPVTVRYYARIGLLTPSRDPNNGYRRFRHADLRRLGLIRKGQDLGLSLGDIRKVLASIDAGEAPDDVMRSLLNRRLDEVQAEIRHLQALRERICAARSRWCPDP